MSTLLTWQEVGSLNVTASGRLPLLHIPATAGIYRIITDDSCYIGQAGNIRHRVYEYHRPTQGIEHEQRLHRLLRKSQQVTLSIVTGPEMENIAYRRSLELAAWGQAEEEGLHLLNISRHPKKKQYEMLLHYHEMMANEYRSLLERTVSS